ncbi:MAG: OmpA family protein [Pseudomonadota bacterium]
MNNLIKLAFAASALVTLSASAQDIKANTPKSAYVQDSRGVIARDPFGLCWRTGYWTPADAVPGCDGEIPKVVAAEPKPAPVVEKPAPAPEPATAPAVVAPAPVPEPAPALAPAPAPAPVSEKVTFSADAFFDFDKSLLKPDGKAKLDDLTSKLKGMNLEVIIAVGHTDSIGTDAYNQKLSIRRAESVKAYLVTKGIEANRVYTEGKGEKQAVADNKSAAGRAKNRRVEIEVVGTRTK